MVTEDISCQTDFQDDVCRTKYNESDPLICALKKHIQSLERQLDEKQIIIESLFKTIQTFSYNNTVANSNHKFDRVSLQNTNSSHGEMKIIDNNLNQIDDIRHCISNDNLKKISETKDNQSMISNKTIDGSESIPTTESDKVIDKDVSKQTDERTNNSERTNIVTPPKSKQKKTVVIVGDSIVRNVPSRSLNQSLKDYFSVVKSFPGATTQDMKDYIKPTVARKPDQIILHTGTNDLKSSQSPTEIANDIINLAKSMKSNGTEVSISSLIPRGDRLSEKGKKVNEVLQEKCTAENLAFILHKNINSKLDLFPDKLHPNKKGQGILKGNFKRFINEYV